MISIIGGTYREIDFDEITIEIFGSGYRGAKYLLENKCNVDFYTSCNDESLRFLMENKKVYKNLELFYKLYSELITFKYSYPLDQPKIFPNLFNISKTEDIYVNSENIIAFGMLETDFKISAKKVVYDPQTSINPKKFSELGKCNELVYIINTNEAKSLASSSNIEDIKSFFLKSEKVKAFILKNGPFGAKLYYDDNEIVIPSFITNNVNKIGSGDIFTSSFGYYWLEHGLSIDEAALYASKTTAYYCDKKAFIDIRHFEKFEYNSFIFNNIKNKIIYLASPFFSLSELILIDKIRSTFIDLGINVISPFHDIGLGDNINIAKKDIEGIDKSDIIFCMFDNLDSGTIIEAGYSLAKNKKIICYHRTCNEDKLLMLTPGNIRIFNNLTTAIYHTIWNL